ncbi:MAG: hypothetical protein IJP03_02705 [Christensenellaceae bacterium]|nr:hypothetical protein [Christensenellaceae bacterium]
MNQMKRWTGIIEALSFFSFLCVAMFFATTHAALPGRIAQGFLGKMDFARDAGTYMLVAFWLGVLCYSLLFLLKRFPRLMSYPVRLTPENMDFQARWSRLMLSIITLLCMCIVLFVIIELYLCAVNAKTSSSFLPVALLFGGIVASVVIYLVIARKHK